MGFGPRTLVGFCLFLVSLVGLLDYVTGYELAFSIFYLIPIAASSWWLGTRAAILISILSASVWLVVDLLSGIAFSQNIIVYWNAAVRTGFFILTSLLLLRLRQAHEDLVTLAERDGLTGLLNFRAFNQQCQAALQIAVRQQSPVAVGYLDLDGFKGINDKMGHAEGDEVLKAVAVEVGKQKRRSDLVGRVGGDEFVFFLPATNLAGAEEAFNKIHRGLSVMARQRQWPVGFSVGVAVFDPAPDDLELTLNAADKLMFEVKRTGKNKLLFKQFSDGFGPNSLRTINA